MLNTFIKILLVPTLFITVWELPISYAVEAPELPIEQRSYEQQITYYSELYGADPKVTLAVARCESGFSQKAIGDQKRAVGIYQYHLATFQRHSKLKGEELDRTSAHDQIKLATWAIANGYGNEWTAYRAIKNGGTYSFYSKLLGKHYTAHCKL